MMGWILALQWGCGALVDREIRCDASEESPCPSGFVCKAETCVEEEEAEGNGGEVDAGFPTQDAGPLADSGPLVDSGPLAEAGNAPDSGLLTDGGGAAPDASSPISDSGVDPLPADGGSTTESGPLETDSGMTVDAGVALDAANPPTPDAAFFDAGMPQDAGALDAGSAGVDAGTDAGTQDAGQGNVDSGPSDAFDVPWWNSAWPERIRIRVYGVWRPDSLTNAPVALYLDSNNLDYAAIGNDETRIRLVDHHADPNGIVLNHEVEVWNPGGVSIVWVLLDTLPPLDDDRAFFLYTGGPGGTPPGPAPWSSTYSLVLHGGLNNGDPAQGPIESAAGHTISLSGEVPLTVAGQTGSALGISDNSGMAVSAISGASFPQSSGAISFWASHANWDVNRILFGNGVSSIDSFTIDVANEVADWKVVFRAASSTGGEPADFPRTSTPNDTDFDHFGMTWLSTVGGVEMEIFKNGTPINNATMPMGWAPDDQVVSLFPDFGGKVDEFRIHKQNRGEYYFDHEYLMGKNHLLIFEDTPFAPETEPASFTLGGADTPVLLYEFNEGTGTTVADTGAGIAHPLSIPDLGAVQWVPGGLWLKKGTQLTGSGEPTKLLTQCQSSGQFSIEAWVQPSHQLHQGPARIVTFSKDRIERNFTLGQETDQGIPGNASFALRLRHGADTHSGWDQGHKSDGSGHANSPDGSAQTQRTHVVFTHDGSQVCSYIDGVEDCDADWVGDYSGWLDDAAGYQFGIGNEFPDMGIGTAARGWSGVIYQVAVYCTALSPAAVASNYAAGL
jgi:hypothetical protein